MKAAKILQRFLIHFIQIYFFIFIFCFFIKEIFL